MTPSHALEPILAESDLARPYIVAGRHAYLIGRQDGSFPDMGWHEKGEMGGLWVHPIKLLDGFWLRVGNTWLSRARRFRVGAYWVEHEYDVDGLTVVRHEFVPDSEPALVVRYSFTASTDNVMPVRFLARADFHDVWPATDREHGADQASYLADLDAWSCRTETGDWHVVLGTGSRKPAGHSAGRDLWGPETTGGRGMSVALDYELQVTAGETAVLDVVIAGSDRGFSPVLSSYQRVVTGLPALRRARDERCRQMLARSSLEIPDPSVMRAWNWVKCNYDWLVREVQPWGSGLGAGVADYPWWFGCDNGYALRGCLALGQHEIAIDTLDLLRRVSTTANGDSGRVIHEANTRGTATDLGRTEETPHFIRAVWDTFLWTGDLSFLKRNYDFCKAGLLEWTLGEQCRDGDVLPYGYGIMEMLGLNLQCVDTASLTAEALERLAGMAAVLGDGEVANRCHGLAATVRRSLEDAFWMESEGLYGDMVATPAEMAPRLRVWMGESKEHPEVFQAFRRLLAKAESDPEQERKRPWLLKNWSVLCPLEAGLTPSHRALRTLERAEGPEFTGPWGVYINGLEHRHMMSIGTGVLAVAEVLYGRPEQSLAYIRLLTDTLEMQMPGAISEMSPDWGCFVQAWSGYGVAWPVVAGIFGVQPDAFHRRIELAPSFPESWKSAQLLGLRVGSNSLDLRWDGTTLSVTSQEPGWDIRCGRLPMQLERGSLPA